MYHLKTFLYLLVTLICFVVPVAVNAQSQSDCKYLEKIRVDWKQTTNEENNDGKLIIKADEGINLSSLSFHLFAPKKEDNKLDLKLSNDQVADLKKGAYLLIIQDRKTQDCTKHISFQIN